MNKGISNFLKVFFAASTKPTRIFTLGIGLIMGFIFPDVQLFILPASLVAVAAMSWADVNDPEFMKSVLLSQSTPNTENISLEVVLKQLESLIKSSANDYIKDDLLSAKESIEKINSSLINLQGENEFTDAEFVKKYVEKIVEKLIKLSRQEQLARNYLSKEDKESISKDIDTLRKGIEQTNDSIAKKEYEKAIILKEEQRILLFNVETRLERIDSYIARIKIVLDQTFGYLTKVSLRDESDSLDDSEILTESLKQIVQDIDTFEDKTIEIGQKLNKEVTAGKLSLEGEKTSN